MFEKGVNITVTADTKPLQQGIRDAQRSLGTMVADTGKVGTALLGAEKKAAAFGAALRDGVGIAGGKAFGNLVKEVQKSTKPIDDFSGAVVKLVAKLGIAGEAMKIAKQYFEGLFDRAKIDPALEAV